MVIVVVVVHSDPLLFQSMVVVFELSVDVFFGGGGGARLDLVTAADPELGEDVDADAGANVTDDEVGVEAIIGSVGCVPFRTVIGMVSDDVTIIATDAGLEWDKKVLHFYSPK